MSDFSNIHIKKRFNLKFWREGLTVIIRPVSVPNWTDTELAKLNWAWQNFFYNKFPINTVHYKSGFRKVKSNSNQNC